MKEKGFGGGNTVTGLNFEKRQDILSLLDKAEGYSVKGNAIYYLNKETDEASRRLANRENEGAPADEKESDTKTAMTNTMRGC